MSVVGIVKWPRGQQEITDSDLLWLARSLAGETSPTETGRAAAAWAMLQRMVWQRDQGHTNTTGMPCSRAPTGRGVWELEPVRRPLDFTGALRCFSSPINPYQTDRVAARKARRRFFISASYDQLEQRSPGVKDFAYRFGRGEVLNPVPGAADFDAHDEVPAGATVLWRIGGNSFMGEPGFPRTPGYVTIEPATGLATISTPMLVAGAGLTVAAVAVAYFAWRAANKPKRRNASRRVRYTVAVRSNRLGPRYIEVVAHGKPSREAPLRGEGADVVGYLRAFVHRDAVQIDRIGVDPANLRRGIATRMYELAAEIAQREFGLPLRSDEVRSAPAEAFWQKQQAKGRARFASTHYELAYPPPKTLKNNRRRRALFTSCFASV